MMGDENKPWPQRNPPVQAQAPAPTLATGGKAKTKRQHGTWRVVVKGPRGFEVWHLLGELREVFQANDRNALVLGEMPRIVSITREAVK